mmetsp:Transcript_6821/g.7741  ORF Transcript_6821/g.7741 Transcript_6821/m.7741 type:complete len:1566 (+) Transcript_6821:194-4891(+)
MNNNTSTSDECYCVYITSDSDHDNESNDSSESNGPVLIPRRTSYWSSSSEDESDSSSRDEPSKISEDDSIERTMSTTRPKKEERKRRREDDDDKAEPEQMLLPDLLNDENVPVNFGGESKYQRNSGGYSDLYCGRYLGTTAIPNSDGRCGPTNGPSCSSCDRLKNHPSTKREILKRLFPAIGIQNDSFFITLLRRKYGHFGKVKNYILDHTTAKSVDEKIALSRTLLDHPKTSHYNDIVQRLAEATAVPSDLAEHALREEDFDVYAATSFIADFDFNNNKKEYQSLMADVEVKRKQEEKEAKLKNQDREETILEIITDGFSYISEALKDDSFCTLISEGCYDPSNPPTMIIQRGHRMLLRTTDQQNHNNFNCIICSSNVPSQEGGSYFCSACGICEGCVQTKHSENEPFTAIQCQAVANGGHLHHHPMKMEQKRAHSTYSCDICEFHGKNDESHEIAWSCIKCDFDVCIECARRPAPMNYDRQENEVVNEGYERERNEAAILSSFVSLYANEDGKDDVAEDEGDDDDGDDEKENSDACTSIICPEFDDEEAKRTVAAHWEYLQSNFMLLGNGVIDSVTQIIPLPRSTQRRDVIPTTLPIEGIIPDDAKNALHFIQSSECHSASDATTAEDILRSISPTASKNNASYETLLSSISAGRVGIAGTLLLSNLYSPKSHEGNPNTDNNDGDGTKKDPVCWCGDVINSDTAPDGAVGCLSGHAMHASCAADLLMGGGRCPTCRQILFYSKVAKSEIKSASNFTKDEMDRIRFEEEERVKQELEILARDGLPITFNVGDIVQIPSDQSYCKQMQLEDPQTGWWHDEMRHACGLTGMVSEIVNDGNQIVSVRVHSKGSHKFQIIRHIDDFNCEQCAATRVGRWRCIYCNECDSCVSDSLHYCSKRSQNLYWNPSLLTLLCRGNGSPLAFMKDSDAFKAEQHILRLRGEVVAIKKAREDIQKNMLATSSRKALNNERQLSAQSRDAFLALVQKGFSAFDCERARHLLLLGSQWVDSDAVKSKRLDLYDAVKEGNLDSAARVVRRYNCRRTFEESKWESASVTPCEYVVESFAVVELRAFPSVSSPRTGFVLNPQSTFSSGSEVLDVEGNHWMKVTSEKREDDPSIWKDPPPPSQGWLRVRPGGDTSAPIVKRAKTCLRCFGCGDNLFPAVSADAKYDVVKKTDVKKGDTLLVASTFEKVQVDSSEGQYITCSFVKGDKASQILYRPCDLVKPKSDFMGYDDLDETRLVRGRLRSRRELILSDGEMLAKTAWDEAENYNENKTPEFASCVRGHLLHSRCFQEALLSGSRCPAPGCVEPLFLPPVTRVNTDDDTCCGGARKDEVEVKAIQAASELAGHSALLGARAAEDVEETSQNRSVFGENELRMCPMCCAGPLINNNCTDMSTHHGQCALRALKADGAAQSCTPDGDYRASASDIAARMLRISATKTVADLLPRCETHKCPVMFNGCMSCGHLFTDINWDNMPKWDASARLYLELDKKKRNASRLLTDQIHTEAALLEFERDAFCEAGGQIDGMDGGWNGQSINTTIEPPPMPIKLLNTSFSSSSSDDSSDY